MTTTDYIGMGALVSAFFSGLVSVINSIKLNGVHKIINGNTTAQNALIATLHNTIEDKTRQLSDIKETAAVDKAKNGS